MPKTGLRLVILPDADRVEAHLQAVARARGVADGAWVWTLSRLEACCAQAAPVRARPVSPIEARWVVAEVARTVRPAVFGASVEQAAFARQALGVFEELEAGGIAPEAVMRACRNLEPLTAERVQGLVAIWVAWRQRMEGLGWAGRSQQLALATSALEAEGLPAALKGVTAIQLRALHDFPSQRVAFLLALGRACGRAGIDLELRVPGAGQVLVDAAVDPLLRALEGAHADLPTTEAEKELLSAEVAPWSRLGEHLFRRPTQAGVGADLAAASVLWSAATPSAELDQLVREVVRRLRTGVAPERIAIALRNLGTEAEALADRLGALRIPVRVRVGAPLAQTTLGRLALELPLLVDEGFPVEGVARLLSVTEPEGASGNPTPSVLLREAGIRNDRRGASATGGAYAVRLAQQAARFERQGRDTGALRRLSMRCEQLIATLQALPAEGAALELCLEWWKAVESLGLLGSGGGAGADMGEATHSGLARLLAASQARHEAAGTALRQLFVTVREALQATGMGKVRMRRRDFARWLADAAVDLRVEGAQGGGPAAVEILELRELVGRRFDFVAIGGLTEGRLPGRGQPDPLLDERERQALNRVLKAQVFRLWSGEDEGIAPWRLAEDRLLFFLALSAADREVSVGYARADELGREQEVSSFLTEFSALLEAPIRRLPARVIPAIEDAETADAVRERIAWELYADPVLRGGGVEPPPPGLAQAMAEAGWLREAARISSMEAERLRAFAATPTPSGPYSGRVEGDGLSEVLAQRFAFGDERPLSATALEALAGCRYRGFLRIALGLREPEEAGEDLDARGEGVLHHRVLELLFARLKEGGLLGLSAEALPERLLEDVVERALADVAERTHTGHPALWALGRERALRMVRRVLGHAARGLPFEGAVPEETERRFGTPDAEAPWRMVRLETSDPAAPVHLTGTIDRLDASGAARAVVDYKLRTRRAGEYAQRLLVQDFQLPLYLLAARAAGYEAEDAAWLSLKDGAPVPLSEVLAKAGVDADLLLATDPTSRRQAEADGAPNVANAVSALVEEARAGHFPIASEDCGTCAFRPVCRISERRAPEEELA